MGKYTIGKMRRKGMPRSVSAKYLDATGAVKAAPGFVHAISLAGGAAAAGTVILDDSTAGGGTNKWKMAAPTGGGDSVTFDPPIYFAVGIYATLAGSGAVVSIAYE